MYRVRKSWQDAGSQVGAYNKPEYARNACEANPTFTAYDEAGNAVYTSANTVPTMSYKAKLLRTIEGHKKGSTVIVTRDLEKRWLMKDGIVVKQKSYMDLLTQIYDPSFRLSAAEAEAWINARGTGSKTGYLFWANKYGQRVYVFQGSKKNWKMIKTFKCGTGNISYGDGSDQGVGFKWQIWDKDKAYPASRGIQYYNQHYSSKWGNSIHKGPAGKPCTHGCISLKKSAAIWVFNTLPIGTRVVVF